MDSHQHHLHHNHPQQSQTHQDEPYVTLRTRAPRGDGASMSSADSTYGSGAGVSTPSATHDTSRVNFHVKHLETFAKSLEDSAGRAFPNRGLSMQRYSKVQVLLLHWKSDDLFVLPELEDLEQCMREDYSFETDIFAIPSENSHLELMLKVGSLIKDHESTDTLFIVYYGGHARIDESRQSTWCATRHSGSPWLQWSAIQTLLERSVSDTLILLDCCAGAASATFPNGKSITETISASSWDAIAPDPGRYSFTNALIEVLQQWKVRTFSAAMLHAEVLARLKHPRPITINGKHFEARSTPVHFMMTSNHKAPSIELGRIVPENRRPPSPPDEPEATMPLPSAPISSGRGGSVEGAGTEPTEHRPHVMISLALEDNQQLDLDAWEQWLASFPALAKYVKVQGVFKSHSTLLLLSLPVMIWDLLPEDHACNFVAFIRSNNMIKPSAETNDTRIADNVSISGTTQAEDMIPEDLRAGPLVGGRHLPYDGQRTLTAAPRDYIRYIPSSLKGHGAQQPRDNTYEKISRNEIMNTSRSSKWTVYHPESVPEAPRFNSHIVARLEEYFNNDPEPSNAAIEYYASNLGAQTNDISLWFYHRHKKERDSYSQSKRKLAVEPPPPREEAIRMILPGHLNRLLEIYPSQVLFLDLRPPTDFQRSHIHRAANLRAPVSFLEHSTIEMIEGAFSDETSHASFSKWYSAKCVVIYDRVIEFSWECPTAEVLYDKFRSKGWTGRFFVLKGPYREFSASYEKYIVGAKTSTAANEYLESLEHTPPTTADQVVEYQDQYEEWLRLVENEDRVPSANLTPAKQSERLRAMQQNQEALENEFQSQFPELYRQSVGKLPQQDPWPTDRKERIEASQGPLVAPLSRALDKMHEAGMSPPPAPPPPLADRKGSSYSDKLEGSSGRSGGYPPDKPVGGGRGGYSGDKMDVEQMEDEDMDGGGPGDLPGGQAAVGVGGGSESSKKRHQQQQPFWKRLRSSRS
ncbi:hypothetical protein MGG_06285 [Pyricularia oryzae 70-15]|uniref:Homeobox domain-containing protein n=1 Tax=Pyricularia oryzae (strain 70-15 / ATCC MYA-4617 / FGSC 8958) TaxID=242507 RepID=G4N881_PYRO7|nr:uncharacterized protein MGG_06285 [Pyricularia oryzae 70-15]EHA50982.1 hypothetical protein MGG_06285 [Pyricularia oryzae 70-15]